MVSYKGNKTSRTSSRPVLRTHNIYKNSSQTKEEKVLQKKILKEGLSKRGEVPVGNIALEKSNVASFQKKNKSVRKSLKKRTAVHRSGEQPGIVCLTNLPHGFYEKELKMYFSQFGDVNHSRVIRSKLTGRSCGYAYVEFRDQVVARIAAEAMDNYLTYGKIIKCRLIRYTRGKSLKLFGGEPFLPENCPKVLNRGKAIISLNAMRNGKQVESRAKRVMQNLDKKLKMLQELGVKLDLDIDTGNMNIVKKEASAASSGNVKKEASAASSGRVKKEASAASSGNGDICSLKKMTDNSSSVEDDEKMMDDSGKIKKDEPITSGDDGSNSTGCKHEIIFEADQSEDEIILKTPPFAKKKFVKITPSSPAVRVSGKLKVTEATTADDTPKSLKPKKSLKTPKVNKTKKQMSVSEKKNSVKKRKVSQSDVEGNNNLRKQKRLSL